MPISADHHLRIARPCLDLAAAERFYAGGLGLVVQWRVTGRPGHGERDLLMLGPENGSWHLELARHPDDPLRPSPTPEDLLVLYLDGDDPTARADRLVAHGGTVVPAYNPYWDDRGVTVADPDGYRVVLTARGWRPVPFDPRS